MRGAMNAIVCMKWGDLFGPEYVNILYRHVAARTRTPFRFICLTEDGRGLRPEVEVRPLPALSLPGGAEPRQQGRWRKLSLFLPGVVDDFDLVMYLDLDLVILGSLDPFFERARGGGLHIIREWNPALWEMLPVALRPVRGANSSVMCWNPREQHEIALSYQADPEGCYRDCWNEQEHVWKKARGLQFWPENWCVSFKRACVWYYPFNLVFKKVPKPDHASIVVFHGRPRPVDLVRDDQSRWGARRKFGYGPVPWMKDYWRAGLEGSTDGAP